MATPDDLPLNSIILVTDRCDNDGRNGASSDYDDDEEEGEPPSISPFNSALLSYAVNLSGELSAIMTTGRPHCRPKTTRTRCRGSVRVEHLGHSWFVSTLVVIIFLCSSTMSCVADDAAGIISWSHEQAPADKISAVISENEASAGIRGATQSAMHKSDQSGKCNYECCSDFIDAMSRNDVENRRIEYDDKMNNQRSIDVRMLQELNSTLSNPCPIENEKSEGGVGMHVAVQYILIIILVAFSALFSGLTLGLMSLDPSGLEIVMANSDDPAMARAAKAIYPVRINGNLLLCTLLLGNVGVNSMLSILMADLTSGLVGFLVSTAVIVIFGEIIPQAICSRFALQVGEKTVPAVKVIMVLLYPICKPLSFVLNRVLGREIGTTYSKSEMAKLIEMHVQSGELEGATGEAMKGALRYRTISVSEVMTPLVNTFMLSSDERLGFDTVAKIFKTGYSRIPVYEVSKSNIIGLLFVKDLIFLDPEDEIPVKNFVQIFGRGLHVVWPDDKLGDVLKLLKRGRSHMALVRGVNDGDGKVDPFYEIQGIITLEDIIEIILGDEIIDETDELVDVNDPATVVRRSDIGEYIEGSLEKGTGYDSPIIEGGVSDVNSSHKTIDWESRLRLLDERLVDEHLSSDEVRAVTAHLKTNYSNAVELISDRQLKELLSLVPVTEILPPSLFSTADGGDDGSGVPSHSSDLIYERGVATDFCTVVLSGKIMVMSGADKFRSDVSNWGVLASRALTDPNYVPDFSAWVLPNQNSSGGCRCVKLDRMSFCDAVDNTALERTDHHIHLTPPAANVPAIVTKGSPLVLNGKTEKGPLSQNEIGSKMTSALGHVELEKAGGAQQIDSLVQLPTNNQLLPQTPRDMANVEHNTASYVETDDQRRIHSRRSKLLKAFTRVSSGKTGKG